MKRVYKHGDRVRMSRSALENYGQKYAGIVFTVDEWYDHYCPAHRISIHDPHGHPGYDGATGDRLYHLTGLSFDLYGWEIERA